MMLNLERIFDLFKVLNARELLDLDINSDSFFGLDLLTVRINDGDVQCCQVEISDIYKFFFFFLIRKYCIAGVFVPLCSLFNIRNTQCRSFGNLSLGTICYSYFIFCSFRADIFSRDRLCSSDYINREGVHFKRYIFDHFLLLIVCNVINYGYFFIVRDMQDLCIAVLRLLQAREADHHLNRGQRLIFFSVHQDGDIEHSGSLHRFSGRQSSIALIEIGVVIICLFRDLFYFELGILRNTALLITYDCDFPFGTLFGQLDSLLCCIPGYSCICRCCTSCHRRNHPNRHHHRKDQRERLPPEQCSELADQIPNRSFLSFHHVFHLTVPHRTF